MWPYFVRIDSMLWFLALVSVIELLSFTAYLIVVLAPKNTRLSVSERAASKPWLRILFGGSLTVFGSLFLYYLFYSFGPVFHLPAIFYLGIGVCWIAMLFTAWIPAQMNDTMSGPHFRMAFVMALSMTVIMGSILFAHSISGAARALAGCVALFYLYTIYLWAFERNSRKRDYFLIYELINVALFLVVPLMIGDFVYK